MIRSFDTHPALNRVPLPVPVSDVVYIATIHPYHHATVRLFLAHKRNILCEKPLTLSLQGAQDLITEAKAAGVFFMEVKQH